MGLFFFEFLFYIYKIKIYKLVNEINKISRLKRISLTSTNSFILKQVMFKRNLLKQKVYITNSNIKLIIFDLHLEAYDDNGTCSNLYILKCPI